jgi:arsenical pump membrane protein
MAPVGASLPVLVIGVLVVAGMLLRPWRLREWQWALGGAIAVVAARGEPVTAAWAAIAGGASVYAFLAGIAIIAEVARAGGVFDALAARARAAAGGSRSRLFLLVFVAGAAVTALLSNDTTALVLTPAIFAALEASGVDPLPYLYACAFVANAASFVLPFSNPANLVTYGGRLPPLGEWFGSFGLAAAAAVVGTYLLLWLAFRAKFRKPMLPSGAAYPLPPRARFTGLVVAVCAMGMVVAAALGWNVGVATLLLSLAAAATVAVADRAILSPVARSLPWQILPLVAGLFVVVDALARAGILSLARDLLDRAATLPPMLGNAATALGTAAASGAFNNLPVAMAVARSPVATHVFHAAIVGIDLGPNLCATGSLSTLLWLIAVRREGLDISAGSFFRTGLSAGLPALAVAALLVR